MSYVLRSGQSKNKISLITRDRMAPKDISQDRSNTPDPVEKGFATLSTLRSVLDCLVTCILTPGC